MEILTALELELRPRAPPAPRGDPAHDVRAHGDAPRHRTRAAPARARPPHVSSRVPSRSRSRQNARARADTRLAPHAYHNGWRT
eukprot:3819985-Prymnesium_polylepis.1